VVPVMRENYFDDEIGASEAPQPPSKSQLKREATALQDLGEQLVSLSAAQLNRIPLPDEVLAAVRAAQTMPQRGAHKRQLQFIGKLMRGLDETEIEAIRAALARFQAGRR